MYIKNITSTFAPSTFAILLGKYCYYNENNVPPAQLQKTPLNRKGILAAVPIC